MDEPYTFNCRQPIYSCCFSTKISKYFYRVFLGTYGESKDQNIYVVEANLNELYARTNHKHSYMPIQIKSIGIQNNHELFLTAGEQLRLFKYSEHDQTLHYLNELVPKSAQMYGPITSFDFHSSMPNQVVSGSIDSTISIWDIEKRRQKYQGIAHSGGVLSVSFSMSPDIVATLGNDHQIGRMDLRTVNQMQIIGSNSSVGYQQITWNKQADIIAATDNEAGFVDLIDNRMTNTHYQRLRWHKGYISSTQWMPNDRRLITGGEDGKVYVYGESNQPESMYDGVQEINNLCVFDNFVGIVYDKSFRIVQL